MKQVFAQKKRQGLSDHDAMIEAAHQATDLMDFGRHGSGTLSIRALIPSFNAHLVVIDKAGRTLLSPLLKALRGDLVSQADVATLRNASLAWTKVAGIGGALGYVYGLYARQHDACHDADDELRAIHLIILGDAFGRQGKIVLVPKPLELALGFNLGELIGRSAATSDPHVGDTSTANCCRPRISSAPSWPSIR